MTDPLAQAVGMLRPDLSYSKLVEAAGAWRVRRMEAGRPFFAVILDGAPCLEVEGHPPLLLQAGDFVLIPSADDFVASSTEPAPSDDIDTMPVEMRPNLFRIGEPEDTPNVRMLIGYCAFGSPDAALLLTLLPRLVHVRGDERLTMLARLADEEARSNRPAREVVLGRLMEVLLIEALRAGGTACASGLLGGLADDRLAVALRQIHQRPTAPWTVASLAREAAMSRSAFFERFKRAVGAAPMEYLLQWRMVLAKERLRRGDGTVAEIARGVGYGSASTFSVAFSRHVGVPPSSYARNVPIESLAG